MVDQLDAKKLVKNRSRREFLKDAAVSLGAGAACGLGAKYGLDCLADALVAGIAEAERQVRESIADVKALLGTVDSKLAVQVDQLEKHYNSQVFRKFEELGIADPADIKQFEQIIKNANEFEDYYGFAERAKEYKDRIDRRLLTLDEKLEKAQPGAIRRLNDTIRDVLGKPAGKQGEEYRKGIKQRIDALCAIYNANENNRIAQTEVLKKINEYLDNPEKLKLATEERELYLFLRKQCEIEGNDQHVKEFIRKYDRFEARNEILLRLRAHVTETENIYAKICENKEYVIKLQGLLKEGISQAEDLRSKSQQDFARHRKEISDKVDELKGAVNSAISDLKRKGYDIETREDYINKGTFASAAKKTAVPIVNILSCLVGGIAAFYTRLYLQKFNKLCATNAALEEAVNKYNTKGGQNAN